MKVINQKIVVLGLCLLFTGKIWAAAEPNGAGHTQPQPQQVNPNMQMLRDLIAQENQPPVQNQPQDQRVPQVIIVPRDGAANQFGYCLKETANTVALGAAGAALVCGVQIFRTFGTFSGFKLGRRMVGWTTQTAGYALAATSLKFMAPGLIVGGLGGASCYYLGKQLYVYFRPEQQPR